MKSFEIIVAVDEKNGIGKADQLPWRLPADMKHFKQVTTTTKDPAKVNAVIMGRKTWASIPEKFRPLSQRRNVVLTKNQNLSLPSGVLRASSLEAALTAVEGSDDTRKVETVFIIGGASLYRVALAAPGCQRIYLTKIYHNFDCDVFFPEFSKKFIVREESPRHYENGLGYQFFVLEPR